MVGIALSSALALLGAVFIASQAITIQHGIRRAKSTATESPAFAAALTTIVVSVVIFWAMLLVRGVPTDAFTVANAAPFVVAGVLNPAIFRLLYFRGIEEVGPSIAAAFMAMNPLVAVMVAVPTLGEAVTVATGLGVVCIVAGGVVIQLTRNTMDETGDGTNLDVVTRQLARADPRGLLFPIGSTVFIGVSYVIIKYGLTRYPDPVSALAIAQTAALAVFLGLLLVSGRTRRRTAGVNRAALGIFVLAGVFTALGQIANFFAIDIGTAVSVIPLFNTFPLLVLVFSYAIARELPRSPKLIAAVLAIVLGTVLIELF